MIILQCIPNSKLCLSRGWFQNWSSLKSSYRLHVIWHMKFGKCSSFFCCMILTLSLYIPSSRYWFQGLCLVTFVTLCRKYSGLYTHSTMLQCGNCSQWGEPTFWVSLKVLYYCQKVEIAIDKHWWILMYIFVIIFLAKNAFDDIPMCNT